MSLHINTPRMSVFDPRGLSIGAVDYCRTVEGAPVEPRINRTLHDSAGRAVKQWDPRLWLSQVGDPLTPANLTQVFALDATVLRSDSVDAGAQIELKGPAAQTMFSWDSRQTQREIEHDNLLRPVAIFEEGTGEPRRCVQRLTYGHPGSGDQSRNQFGQLIRHDHPAGSVVFNAFAIIGPCTEDTRHFTLEPLTPDWPEQEADRPQLLEPGVGATSRWCYGALGDVLEQTDARDNRHTFALTVDGRLHERCLQLKGEPEQILVTDIRYNAQGNVTQETAGNGVHTTRTYRPEDDRLLVHRTEDARGLVVQHLSYGYDRMGNVLSIEDKALPIRYFANQRIEPVSRFVYDSLDQLIMASGWESGTVNQGPQSMGRVDPAAVSNYQQTYEYDPGGNLRNLIHVGPQSHGRKLQPASFSNRSLPYVNAIPGDSEIEAAYDRRGNLLQLEPGRMLSWNLRNQLQSVSPVERASGLNDQEVYLYDGSSQRARKIRSLLTNARTLVADVRYLPGLELRTDNGTGERLQVIIADNARVQHWESPPPSGLNNRYRYQHADHLGSVSLETADDGALISRERFHPYGTSAWQDGEFSYKYIRYSGKERDASGLDYYGYRYYISWLQKWSNPDPAGEVDGLNLYRMVRNNPMTLIDVDGRAPQTPGGPKAPPPPPPIGLGPPPPPPGARIAPAPGLPQQGPPAQAESFTPIVLTPPGMPANIASPSWRTEDFVDVAQLVKTINQKFGLSIESLAIEDVTHEQLFERIRSVPGNESMQFNNDELYVNPAAWTSPEGVVYMGVTAPDYSVSGELDVDKIRSTIIHESMHLVSHEHVGFQSSTDTSISNSNYDEYVTDFFAYEVFTAMYPDSEYKTGYFTKDVGGNAQHWGGNMAKYMLDSGHVTRGELQTGYFNTGKLKAMSDQQLDRWKTYAKQSRNPLRMG